MPGITVTPDSPHPCSGRSDRLTDAIGNPRGNDAVGATAMATQRRTGAIGGLLVPVPLHELE